MEQDIVYHDKKYIKHTSQGDPSKIISQLLKALVSIEMSLVNNSPQSQQQSCEALKDKTQDIK